MSAIGGIWSYPGPPPDQQSLARMIQNLQWMGPDQQHCCYDQQVGLIQCTLSPASKLQQTFGPLRCQQTGCVVTADCRLDNCDDIIAQLNLQIKETRCSDLEVILAAYLHWGDETPQHLLGDFALAIWDPRHQHLFCARDHMGVRPLYYLHNNSKFALASHPSALLALPGIDSHLNEQHIACFLLQLLPEDTDTFYQAIHRLPPGHQLKIQANTLSLHQYWSPLHVQTTSTKSFHENAEQFLELFNEAVRCRTLDSQHIASTLSGGLDSSAITCVATQLSMQRECAPLHTFSAIFPSIPQPLLSRIDERKYIDVVEHQCNPIAHHLQADQLHPFITLEKDLTCVGQPFFGPNMYIHNAMFEQAAKTGTPVFLDGIDGDSVLSYGFELFPSSLCTGHWQTLLSEITALKTVSNSRQSLARLFTAYAVKPLIQAAKSRLTRFGYFQENAYRLRLSMLQPEFYQRINVKDLVHRHYKRLHLPTLDASAHHRAHLAQPFLSHILEIQAFFSARHALNIRFPFLDHRLVQFCLTLPPEQKFRQGWSRAIQRQAMKTIVPDPIIKRISKADLSPNFFIGLQAQGPRLLKHLVLPAQSVLDEYLQVERISYKFNQAFGGGYCPLDEALFFYTIANFSTWRLQTDLFG